jgi:DNA-3-methyladenine glycosylase II
LIASFDIRDRKPRKQYFVVLVSSIIGQQISVKAAASIRERVAKHFKRLTPARIVAASPTELRALGLSPQKITYLHDLAAKFLDGTVTPRRFSRMTDEEIITELVQVKGIGRWTAEMFLIFSLGREDVWAVDDLGLQNAVQKTLGLRTRPTPKQMVLIGKRWAPYRSVASLFLWKSLYNTALITS